MRAPLRAGFDVRSKWCDVPVEWSSVTSFEKFKIEGRQTANSASRGRGELDGGATANSDS